MKNVFRKVYSYLSASRPRKAMARMLAVVVVFATTYSLVLPAITKTIRLNGEVDGVSVEVEAMSHVVPDGTELILGPVLLPEDESEDVSARRLTEDEVRLIQEAALDGDETMEATILKAMDISLSYNGNEIEPNDVVRLFLRSDLIRMASRPAIVHLTDDGEAELLEARDANGDVLLYGENFVDELDEIEVPILPEEPYLTDADGNPIKDADGNPIKESDKDLYLWDEEGNLVLDDNGNAVLKPEVPGDEEPVVPPEEDPALNPGEGENPEQPGEGEEKPVPDTGEGEDKTDNPAGENDDKNDKPADGSEDKNDKPAGENGDKTDNPAGGNDDKNDKPATGSDDKNDKPAAGNDDKNDKPAAGNDDKNDKPAGGNDDKNDKPAAGSDDKTDKPATGSDDKNDKPAGGNDDKNDKPAGGNDDKNDKPATGSDDKNEKPSTDGSGEIKDKAERPGTDSGKDKGDSGDEGKEPSAPDTTGGSSDSGEVSVETGGFSVYAIVDLAPRTEVPEEELLTFNGSAGEVDVYVTAPRTAFPEGTTMELTLVDSNEVLDTVSEVVGEQFSVVQAVDISFYDTEGASIEPAEPINVVMRPREAMDTENSKLVHIGETETAIVEDAAFETEQVTFDSGEFSTYVIIITLGKPGEQVYEGDGVTIKVTYGIEANLPEGTVLKVEELEEGSDAYNEYLAKTESALNLDASVISMEDVSLEAQLAALMGGEQKVEKARFFDITLEYNGEEIEPAAPVNVEIKFDDVSEASEGMQIVHFAEQADGTETPEIITPTVEDGTVTYQQSSFSMDAVTVATKYGNGGWWYTKSFSDNTPTYRMRFRYKNGIFELGYPGNFHAAGVKDNADWSWPGDPGYPFTGGAGQLNTGTTIEQILKALAEYGDPTYCSTVQGVDFLMYETYTVDDSNWEANGSRNSGAAETEVWTGEFHSTWGEAAGTWNPKSISINRVGDFGPLIHIKSNKAHPVHARSNVVINNSASSQTAILIEDEALLMMEVNAHIVGGPNKAGAVGTGVYLDKGGSVEFFDNSFVTNMNVAVEQKNGKTRLKTAPNPFGEHNGRNNNDGNSTGVALWPGQSIGKWTEVLPGGMKAVPIYLRDINRWKSGDIVMDSGRWWYNEIHEGGPHNEMYGAVIATDLGANKFYFQNQGVNMALEYYDGGKTYTNKTVTNEGGNNLIVPAGERYPVIRFTRGTVYNVNTNTWYSTLYDAVNNENPMNSPNSQPRGVQSNDTLVFYGSTIEDRDVVIPSDVSNLTIRTSNEGEMPNDERSGSACTAQINAKISVSEKSEVTIQGGDTGGLTLEGKGTIITNNGTLNLKNGVTLSNAGKAVQQNGEFHLYDGVKFQENGTDVFLPCTPDTDNHVITLEAANPGTVKVGISDTTQFNGRDIVVAGTEIGQNFDKNRLELFPLTGMLDKFYYDFTDGGEAEADVLELKLRDVLTVKVHKVNKNDEPVKEAEFTLKRGDEEYVYDDERNPHITDADGNTQMSIMDTGDFTLSEKAPDGYVEENIQISFTVSKADSKFTLTSTTDGYKFDTIDDGKTYKVKVVNEAKTIPVMLWKTDAQKKSDLEGAVFALEKRNTQDTTEIVFNSYGKGTYTTGSDGKVSLEDLSIGDYKLTETKAPEGYTVGTAPIEFTVQLNTEKDELEVGEVTGANAELLDNGQTIRVTNNPSTVKIQVFKHGGNKEVGLNGAKFTLTGDGKTWTGTSGEGDLADGYLPVWEVTPDKEYTLTETKVPDGYLAANKTQTIYVSAEGKIKCGGEVISTDEDGVNVMKVLNNPGVPLPSTGGTGTMKYTAIGTMLLLGAAWQLLNRKKESGRE